MKQSLRYGLAISVIFAMLLSIGLDIAHAQKYVTFKGTVVSIDKKLLAVKDGEGTTMNFAMGRKTQFDPGRRPNVGERVEVDYLLRRGRNAAYQVRIKADQ